jgi:hypothetical protein
MSIKQEYASAAVLDQDFRMGTIKDNSPAAQVVTMNNGKWNNTRHGRALSATTAISATITDSSDFDFNGKESSIVVDVIVPIGTATTGQQIFISHFAGGLGWYFTVETTGQLAFSHIGSSATIKSNVALNDGKKHQLVVTLSQAGEITLMYVDGALQTITSTWIGGTLSDANTNITLNTHAETIGLLLQPFIIYAGTLFTAQQAAQLWEETQNEAFLTHIPTKTRVPQPTVDTDAFAMWNGELQPDGTMIDLTGNGNTATTTSIARSSGIYDNSVDYGGVGKGQTSASLDLTDTDVLSLSFWMKKNSNSFETNIFESSANYNATAGTLRVGISATGEITCAMRDAVPTGNYAGSESNYIPVVGEWAHYVVTYDRKAASGSEVKVYINTVDVTTVTLTGFSTATNFGNEVLYFAARGGTSLFGDIQMQDIRVYKGIMTQAKIDAVYEEAKYKLNFYATGEDWNVSPATVSSGFIENTGWSVDSGSHKVADGPAGKVFECVTDGFISIPLEGFYGTWEYDMYNATTNGGIGMYIATARSTSSWNGYGFVSSGASDQAIISKVTNSSGAALATGTAISVGSWHAMKLTRTPAGGFTFYVDGVSAATVTDTTYTTGAKYLNVTMDVGDMVGNFRYSPVIT